MTTAESNMPMIDVLRTLADSGGTTMVFGERVEQDGVVVIPTARVSYAGGGGGGSGPATEEKDASGAGGGLMLNARPSGAFVIDAGHVRWRPAIDMNRVILGGQVVALAALLVARSMIKRRRPRPAATVRTARAGRRG
jgi:uncharacterized spore protein YtfJ